jgi:hypothetical protein
MIQMRKRDCFGNVNGSINNRPNPFLYSITLNFIIPGKIDIIQQIQQGINKERRRVAAKIAVHIQSDEMGQGIK